MLQSETLKEMVTQTYWKELLRMSVQHTLHSNLHHYLSLYKQLVSESHLSKRFFFYITLKAIKQLFTFELMWYCIHLLVNQDSFSTGMFKALFVILEETEKSQLLLQT